MRRLVAHLLLAAALLGGALALSGCVIVPPRAHARVWVPGYWGPPHVWIAGHWRYR